MKDSYNKSVLTQEQINKINEENLALKAVSAEQDDAICYLYESIMEGQENG